MQEYKLIMFPLSIGQADAMAVKIGYPSYILNDTALDADYRNVSFDLTFVFRTF